MQHPALRVTAFSAKIELAMARDLALIELQSKFDQLAEFASGPSVTIVRTTALVAQVRRPASKRVAHMQLE
mgnify:CR=1 FL=1